MASRNCLGRKKYNRKSIVDLYPNIGKDIEKFVEERSVGADAWRRTGVLTFDGNKQVDQKVTYERIRQHLHDVYNRKFAYGTIVQLCVARNRRRKSALRYKGLAQVTSRRARKGFQLKYNPDSHWSNALYKGLNLIQYTDGKRIMNLNRDDAAGFRLDTLATHRLHRSPTVKGKEILTTRSDYINSYPSILQTTSYLFSKTETTGEVFVGIVKGSGVYPKNPAQHMQDLEMLEESGQVEAVFVQPGNAEMKLIECARVDGAGDEGPSHIEVQFWWTLRHLTKPTYMTLVSTRSSGASYLNRVELMNGCLSLAHANLFIPSNLNGTCFDESGKVSKVKLKANMDSATEVYTSRVNGAPCGDGEIKLLKGVDSSKKQEMREHVVKYIKSSMKKRLQLVRTCPDPYLHIQNVWQIRDAHTVSKLPTQYLFVLQCCHKSDCPHPLCGQAPKETHWYPGGPTLDYIPLPTPDPERPWGSSNCTKCTNFCSGHYLSPKEALTSPLPKSEKPPSHVLKAAFDKLKPGEPPSELEVTTVAKECLLPLSEVKIWFEHLANIKKKS